MEAPRQSAAERATEKFRDLYRGKLAEGIDEQDAFTEVVGHLNDYIDERNKMIVENKDTMCDVCRRSGREDGLPPGGALLLDADHTFTIVCRECYQNVVIDKNVENPVYTAAITQNIAINARIVVTEFDQDFPFADEAWLVKQCAIAVALNESRMTVYVLHPRYLSRASDEICTIEPRKLPSDIIPCMGCMRVFTREEQKLMVCRDCRLVHYCSVRCQASNWKVHKIACSSFKDVHIHAKRQKINCISRSDVYSYLAQYANSGSS